MSNYLIINDHRIELTEEQVQRIIAAYNPGIPTIKLSDIAEGDTFNIGAHEFIVLEQSGDTTAVIRKDLLPDQAFGDNNNYHDSNVDKTCCKFAYEIAAIIGAENIVKHTVDLTSDDGLKDYGSTNRTCSLLTADLYRRYVEILDQFNPKHWWWLATAYSTPRHDNDVWVSCVSPAGCIYGNNHFNNDYGVRPFLILNSTIFVSK